VPGSNVFLCPTNKSFKISKLQLIYENRNLGSGAKPQPPEANGGLRAEHPTLKRSEIFNLQRSEIFTFFLNNTI